MSKRAWETFRLGRCARAQARETWPVACSCAEALSAGVRAEQDHVMGHWKHPPPPALPKYQERDSRSVVPLRPHGLHSPWNSPSQNTGVRSCSLLQGIFSTQGWNPGLPHCRQILYQLSHKGSPGILEWVAYPFSSRSSRPRDQTRVSCTTGKFFTNWAIRKLSERNGRIYLKYWREKFTTKIMYPARISFKIDEEIKSFSYKQKLREFNTTKPALQQMLKGLI